MDPQGLHFALHHEHCVAAVTAERAYVFPHKALQRYISHYTFLCSKNYHIQGADNASIRIVPDASGCLVFSLDASNISDPVLWGPSSHAVTVYNGCNIAPLMFFIEFLPGGAAALLHMPMEQLRDAVLPLRDAYPAFNNTLHTVFARYGTENPQWNSLLHELNRVFLLQLQENSHERLARHLRASIAASNGRIRIQELAQETGYSARHLNRVAGEIIGIDLKRFARIVRVNAVCRALVAQPVMPLTLLAYQFDYHDQAHFIHDFNAICGVTPGGYAKTVSDFYNEDLKLGGISPCK